MAQWARMAVAVAVALGAAVASWGWSSGGGASTASEWAVADYARARLVSARSQVGGHDELRLGIQIQLKPEWKTYWRHPGDSGIPPRFDWSRSENLEAATIGWPAPARYQAFGLETIGYKDEVVFPVTAVLAVPGKTVLVRLSLDYAVCRDICVPLKADLALLVPEGTGEETSHAASIKDFSARVPQTLPDPAAIGVPELRKVCFEDDEDDEDDDADGRLRVVFSGLETGGDQDLFVEAGGGFGFGAPETVPETVTVDQEGGVEMTVPVHRYRKRAVLKAQPVRLTLVAGEGAFEWSTTVCPD